MHCLLAAVHAPHMHMLHLLWHPSPLGTRRRSKAMIGDDGWGDTPHTHVMHVHWHPKPMIEELYQGLIFS